MGGWLSTAAGITITILSTILVIIILIVIIVIIWRFLFHRKKKEENIVYATPTPLYSAPSMDEAERMRLAYIAETEDKKVEALKGIRDHNNAVRSNADTVDKYVAHLLSNFTY